MSRRTIENILRFAEVIALAIAVLLFIITFMVPAHSEVTQPMLVYSAHLPKPPAKAYEYSIFRTGPFEVAKVFGRSKGCINADADLIQFTSDTAATAGLDPRIAASVIAVESECDQFAVSSRGALGLMQVMASTWKNDFDFGGDVNLLNRKDNIRVGVKILSTLVSEYGVSEGTRRYNGLGIGCISCDGQYVKKVMTMTGGK